MDTLPKAERYSYVFEGNSQVLDQMLVSDKLDKRETTYDVVHVNAEFFDQASDHDPQVARFVFDERLRADVRGGQRSRRGRGRCPSELSALA